MSGYFGIVRTDGAAVGQDLLQGIARNLAFRGPDGGHIQAKDGVGFSFAFLDLGTPRQARAQPVRLGERFWLIGEVRLDARRELVAALQQKGQSATSKSTDEELLLHTWDIWGETCLPKLLGDFCFGLWDAKTQSLCCARDFAGAKPLFYARTRGVLCFTNTLQVLRYVPEISGEFDDLFVRDFLVEGLPGDLERTIWRDVRRLPAGHRLRFSDGNIEVARFQQLPIEDPLQLKNTGEYVEGFRELFRVAVAERLPEGKCAFYLSGGLDSAAVCAMAARLSSPRGTSKNLKAFTVSWRALMDDLEPKFAKLTARHLGLPLEVLEEARILPYDGTETTTPEPASEVFFGHACRIFRAIAAHSRVILSGDGGDTVLEGEAWPHLQYLHDRGQWAGIARIFGGYFFTRGRIPPMRAGVRSWFRRRFPPGKTRKELPSWLNDEFSNRVRAQLAERERRRESIPVHPVHPAAYRSLHSGYWPSVLEDEDATWTGVCLETRAPFLDQRLLRFLLRLPPVPWSMNKELTRRALSDRLPAEILRRKKTPLPRDPLEACQRVSRWRLQVPENLPKGIHEFVKWNSWLETLQAAPGSFTWEKSYPISFALWLKAIENKRGIE